MDSFHFQHWELLVLEKLNWDLSAVTPYCILDQLLRRLENSQQSNCQVQELTGVRSCAETFIALAATESSFLTSPAALVAVSALVLSLRNFGLQYAGALEFVLSLTGLGLEPVTCTINKIEQILLKYRMQQQQQQQQNNVNVINNNVMEVDGNNRPNLKRKSPPTTTPTEMELISSDLC